MWPTHGPSSDVAMRSHGVPHELSECGECGDLMRFGYAKTSMLLGNRWVLVCFSDFGDFRHVLLINDVS